MNADEYITESRKAADRTDGDAKAKARAICKWAEHACPDALDWAENVRSNHTTYSRRWYGRRQCYCFADLDLVYTDTGLAVLVDPWPAGTYCRAALLDSLMYLYHTGNVSIGTEVCL